MTRRAPFVFYKSLNYQTIPLKNATQRKTPIQRLNDACWWSINSEVALLHPTRSQAEDGEGLLGEESIGSQGEEQDKRSKDTKEMQMISN